MLDTLIINIPIQDEFVQINGNLKSIRGAVEDYQIKAVPSYVKKDLETGELTLGDSYHPFESLPTSHSGMAIKFYATNVANSNPYIALNASVKILQGHNVYGGESVLSLSAEMLNLLQEVYPAFYACLNIRAASIARIHSTFSVALSSESLVQPCLRSLSNSGEGHRKNDTQRDFYNTVYFGGKTSRYGGAKIYGKGHELKEEIGKLQKSAKMGNKLAQSKLEVLTPELVQYSKTLLRFESSTKARQLQRLHYPTNLWQFIDYQMNENRHVLSKLWTYWFEPILNSLKGDIMPDIDDSQVYDLCKSNLMSYTKTGKISYTKANNAYNFYILLKRDGYESVKTRYERRAFDINIKNLTSLGYSKAVLKNLSLDTVKTVPVAEVVKMDFSKQFPDKYTPLISEHIYKFAKYLNGGTIESVKFPNLYDLDGNLLPQSKNKGK